MTREVPILEFFLIVGITLSSPGCRRAAPPGPLHDLVLAESSTEVRPASGGSAVWVTSRAVVIGNDVVGRIHDGGIAEPAAEVPRAVEERRGSAPVKLGVDRRASFGLAWSIVSERHREEGLPLSLLVGSREDPRTIDVCAAQGRRRPGPAREDCWGRGQGRPPVPSASQGDAGQDRQEPVPPNADGIGSSPIDFSSPLGLEVLLGTEALSLRVQGRLLRVLERRGPLEARLEAFSETLASLRRRNDWERRATVRVTREVPWHEVVALLDSLVDAGLAQLRVESALE